MGREMIGMGIERLKRSGPRRHWTTWVRGGDEGGDGMI